MKRFVVLDLLLAVALPAMAQDAAEADWDTLRDPAKRSVIAYIPVTTGLMLGVRCTDGAFDAVIAGLPEHPRGRPTRALHLAFGDEPLHATNWSVTTDRTVAISDYPALFARSLRKGGPLKIMVPGGAGDGRNLVHDLVLPPSSAAIAETMAACDRPLEDPRDALLPDIGPNGLPAGLHWERQPRPRYPMTNFASGYAVISCIAGADGALSQCQAESEQPARGRFAEAALHATRDARVVSDTEPTGQLRPRLIAFRVNFYIDGYQPGGYRN
jgi:hypothetical protein